MADDEESRGLTTRQVAELVRVPYHRLDHWVRAGHLPIVDVAPGSGAQRHWSPGEVELARVFAALVHGGVDPSAAGEALCCGRAAIGPHRFVVELGELIVTGAL